MPQQAPYRRTALATLLSLAAAAAIVACQPAVGTASAAAPEAAPPAPAVTVAVARELMLEPHLPQVGRVEAARRVELRPRVAGHVEAVLFREGDLVRAGQPLLRIDPRPFDVALDRARAELQLARAAESLARSEAERAQRLSAEQAIAKEQLERRTAAHAEAQARMAGAEAAVKSAALDREFATVTAPIDGRIGRAAVTAGNYVAAGASQAPIATLTGIAPLHVHFDIGDPALIAKVAGDRQAGRWQARVLDPQSGSTIATAPIDFVDNEMAAQAGTLRLRARIDKPAPQLVPGQFVRVQLAGVPQPTLLVPEKAIATDQAQRFVLVVKPDHSVEHRPVQLGPLHGDQRAIASGLKAGEQVIVSGLMRARPGMKVQPQAAGTSAAQAPASSPARS